VQCRVPWRKPASQLQAELLVLEDKITSARMQRNWNAAAAELREQAKELVRFPCPLR
jgi:hypothetical protein